MRRSAVLLLTAVLTISVSLASAQNAISRCNLRVIVDGFQSDKGVAKIGLCNTREAFQLSEERSTINATVPIVNGKAEHVFHAVPAGRWAVSAYHDENGNGKLDKGAFGKPLELYGFSNRARGIFSRPEYEKAVILLDRTEMAVRLTVQ